MKNLTLTPLFIALLVSALYSGIHYTVTNGIVRDNTTGLLWMRCAVLTGGNADSSKNCTGTPGKFTWNDAIDACNTIVYNGRNDWRLPGIKELQSIAQYNDDFFKPHINTTAFPNAGPFGVHYWSSTTRNDLATDAYTVDFTFGNVTSQPKTAGVNGAGGTPYIYIRCVTGP
jgi:hypothetical protein